MQSISRELTSVQIISSTRKTELEGLANRMGTKIDIRDLGHISEANLFGRHHLIKEAHAYLAAPTITDEFGSDHSARRKFLNALEQQNHQLYAWYNTNRLGFNNIFAVALIPTIHAAELKSFPKAKHVIENLVQSLPQSGDEYNQLNLADKIKLTRNIARQLEKYTQTIKQETAIFRLDNQPEPRRD